MFSPLAIISWLEDHWESIAIGILILVLAFYVGHLKVEVGEWQGKALAAEGTVAKQRGEISEWKSSYGNLAKSATEQSAGVTELNKQLEEAQKALAEATKAAKPKVEYRQAQINRLLIPPEKPPSGMNECEAAVEHAKESMKGSVL